MSSQPPSTKADFWHFPLDSVIWLKNVENKFFFPPHLTPDHNNLLLFQIILQLTEDTVAPKTS